MKNSEQNQNHCPHCGEPIDVNEVLKHQLEAQYKEEYNQKLSQAKEEIDKKQDALQAAKEKFEEEKREQKERFAEELEVDRSY